MDSMKKNQKNSEKIGKTSWISFTCPIPEYTEIFLNSSKNSQIFSKFGASVTESTKKAGRIRTIDLGLYGLVRYLFATCAN